MFKRKPIKLKHEVASTMLRSKGAARLKVMIAICSHFIVEFVINTTNRFFGRGIYCMPR